MKQTLLLIFLMAVACDKAPPKPKYDHDFTDKAINLAIQNPGNIVELPGLHPHLETFIVPEKDEQWRLADKLVMRGFKEKRRETQDFSLSGQKIVSITLSDTACDCKVSKIYRTTPYTSRYEVSERITCLNKN